MLPFLGIGAGQAIEVSVLSFWASITDILIVYYRMRISLAGS